MAVKEKKRVTKKRSAKPGKNRDAGLSVEALQTRKRILDAAEQIFYRKGFDGARVDEIAEEAGVNKALIYYYFESKKALLEELVNRIIQELVAEKQEAFASLGGVGIDLATGEIAPAIIRNGIELTRRRMPLFGILSTEALKNGGEEPALFRVVDQYMASLLPSFEKMGLSIPRIDELRVPAFFFGYAPLIFFELLKDKWVAYYKVDEKDLLDAFYNAFAKIYTVAMRPYLTKKG